MAGNTCSLIGISTSGNGGYVREEQPGDKSFTISKHNAKGRCVNCGTMLIKLPRTNKCPWCGSINSIFNVKWNRLWIPKEEK